MSFISKDIIIQDWMSNQLYIGPYDSPNVDKVLDANRCDCDNSATRSVERLTCPKCDGTGYSGCFEVLWVDESDKDDCNVYEYINY